MHLPYRGCNIIKWNVWGNSVREIEEINEVEMEVVEERRGGFGGGRHIEQ